MNKKVETPNEVSLIEANVIRKIRTSSITSTRNPNFYRRKLEYFPNPRFICLFESAEHP